MRYTEYLFFKLFPLKYLVNLIFYYPGIFPVGLICIDLKVCFVKMYSTSEYFLYCTKIEGMTERLNLEVLIENKN